MTQRLPKLYLRMTGVLKTFHCAEPAETSAQKHQENSLGWQYVRKKSFAISLEALERHS